MDSTIFVKITAEKISSQDDGDLPEGNEQLTFTDFDYIPHNSFFKTAFSFFRAAISKYL